MKSSFEAEGYVLLSKSYVNWKTPLKYRCPEGHDRSTLWTNWQKGHRCPTCDGQTPPTFDCVNKSFNKEGYTLLSKKYINNTFKLDYRCFFGHKHSISWGKWKAGQRCPTCANIKLSGAGHPNWRGGKSFEPYCEVWKDVEYKQDIKNRDNNMCLNPYCVSKDPMDLTIHHIDYNKKNCSPVNLITVCRSCNSKANKDRTWHKAWYRAILKRRYNYEY